MSITGSILGAGTVIAQTTTIPLSPTSGDRYIVGTGASGFWMGKDNYIAEWDGAAWQFDFPDFGLQQYVAGPTTPVVLEWRSADNVSAPGWQNAAAVRQSSFPYLTLGALDAAAFNIAAPLELDVLGSSFPITSNMTLTASLVCFRGTVLAPSGATLTLAAIDAPQIACFDVASGASVVIVSGSVVNVKWFGAVGDGSLATALGTDNAPAFAAAIACVGAFSAGGELFVPPGIYQIDSALTAMSGGAVLSAGFTLRGAGRQSSILLSNLSSGTMLTIGHVNPTTDLVTDGVNLVDIGFSSTAVVASMAGEGVLVSLSFCRDARVDRCSFLGGYDTQLSVLRPQGPTIRDCDFHGVDHSGNDYCARVGILFDQTLAGNAGQAARIANCTIRDFKVNQAQAARRTFAFGGGMGVNFTGDAGSEFAIADCDIEDNDCGVNCDASRTQIVRNSMETGVVFGGITRSFTAAAYPATNPGNLNTGNGTISLTTPYPNSYLGRATMDGVYTVTCTSIAGSTFTFTVKDPSAVTLGTFNLTGNSASFASVTPTLNFTVTAGSTAFAVNDYFSISIANVQTQYGSFVRGNTGQGTIATNGDPTPATALIGRYVVACTAAGAGGGTFAVTDPSGGSLGTCVMSGGTGTFANEIFFVLTASGTAFAPGDTFYVDVAPDTLIRLGKFALAESVYCMHNTLSGQGLAGLAFFDVYHYREILLDYNLFISLTDGNIAVYLSSDNNQGKPSFFRFNDAINPRTNINFNARSGNDYPPFVDGKWWIEDCSENSTTNGTLVLTGGEIAPSVANLQTLLFENTAATTVTNFANGHNGQELLVRTPQSPLMTTLQNNANIVLTAGADTLLNPDAYYVFRAAATSVSQQAPVWRQVNYQPPPATRTLQSATSAYLTAGSATGSPIWFQYAVDDLVIALQSAGLMSTLDALWLFSVSSLTLASTNLINAATSPYTITWHSSATTPFAAYYGITGVVGNNDYGSTNLFQDSGGNFGLGSASLSAWSQIGTAQNAYAIGSSVATGASARLGPRISSKAEGRVNDGSSFTGGTADTDPGLSTLIRTATSGSNIRLSYRNGVFQASDSVSAIGSLPHNEFYVLHDVNATTYYTAPVSMAAIGAQRSATQEAAFYNALLIFMKHVGVVPT